MEAYLLPQEKSIHPTIVIWRAHSAKFFDYLDEQMRVVELSITTDSDCVRIHVRKGLTTNEMETFVQRLNMQA